LRGARIGVDSPTSGFAPILVRLLDAAGVADTDVELVALGATRGRYQALIEGRIDASMLTLPWSTLAVAAGGHVLGDHTSVAPGLLTSAAIARRRWLDDARETATSYRSMLGQAVAWLRDPASLPTAAAWLAEDLGAEPAIAREVLASMADPVTGWRSDVGLDAGSLDMAHELRASVGRPPGRVASEYLVAA
jgi:ABC-type nitrate/sulfonate/bicarbonate transport system substrate-binding protein